MSVEEILSEASKLSEEERASIASHLIHSLPATHYSVSDDDVALRVQEAEANEDVLIPFEKFFEGIKRGENLVLSPFSVGFKSNSEGLRRGVQRTGKRFLRGIHAFLTKVNENPKLYHFEPGELRRCNLKRFPHHFLYDTRGEEVRLWVLRHDKQRRGHGKRRFRK